MALPCAVEMSSNTATTPSIEKTASSMAEHESYGRDQKKAPNQYKILSSKEILTRLMNLADSYPTFATLTTTQELYNLPRAGTRKDCRFDVLYDSEGVHIGCNNYVLIIQDKEAYPDDDCDIPLNVNDSKASLKSSGWKYIPDVFLSGSVHGNERVGPMAVVEAAELLLEAAYCESLPKVKTPVSRNNTEEIERAKECRASLSRRGISTHHRQWLARLVSTRRTVIIPTANALGYARNERREDGIDVKRDFPFDISGDKSSKCMQSIAARSINELFRSHLFPIGLTYNGGMEVVSYEWGAPTYWNQTAPDTYVQETIAKAYSRYGGKFATSPQYDYGPMNDKVYYVRGGMEDWAFAGSWDPDRVVRCQPMTYGGNYPPEKTIYNNSTLRAFNMLIETSDKKTPRKNSLGTRLDPLTDSDDENNGHVARNIRLALLAMDLAEPYVSIRQVDGMRIEDDVVPGIHPMNNVNEVKVSSRINHCGRNTRKTKTISWTVGGAFEIDSTDIIYGPWTIRHYSLVDAKDGFYPSAEALNLLKTDEFISVKPNNLGANVIGRSRWHENGSFPKSNVNKIDPNPIFEADIDISNFSNGTRLAVFARAKVDSSWARQPKSSFSALGAVSHIVNSRTNPSYFASNGGKIIKGREDNWWYSLPIIIVIGSNNEDDDMEYLSALPDCELEVIAINSRYGDMPDSYQLTMSRLSASRNNNFQDGSSLLGILALVLVMVVFAALVSLKEQRTHREQERRLHQVHLDYGSIS